MSREKKEESTKQHLSTEEQYQRNPWTSSELGSKDPTTVITRRRNGKNRPRKNDQRRRYIASSFVLPLSHLSCRILGRWQLFLLVLGTLVSVFRDIVYTTARRMDRTAELTSIVFSQHEQAPSSGSSNNGNRKFATSPFVLQSSQLLSKLLSFEHLLEVTADAFIDYHRWHPYKHILCGEASNMTDSDRVEFSQQIAIFVTSFATKVRELRRVIGPHDNNGYTMADHREEMVSYLLERLSNFTKTSQRMQKEREKYSLNPLLLLSGDDDMMRSMSSSSSKTHATSNTSENNEFAAMLNKLDTKNVNNKNNTSSSTNPPAQVTQSFVDRYEAEIAPPTRLKAYKSIALKHKEILLKESKDLQVQYSEDLKEAHKMEHTVGHISRLLTEFVTILQTQRSSVDDVHVAGKQATDLVNDTDQELQLTIERSESHSRTMIMLTVGLALLLLLLDFITP